MKKFRITYHLHPEKDIEIMVEMNSEEEAIVYAKSFRNDTFSITEVKEENNEI